MIEDWESGDPFGLPPGLLPDSSGFSHPARTPSPHPEEVLLDPDEYRSLILSGHSGTRTSEASLAKRRKVLSVFECTFFLLCTSIPRSSDSQHSRLDRQKKR